MRKWGDLTTSVPMTFWIIAALLACAATAALVWPLLGARIAQDPESTDSGRRLAVYRDRRDEIERERAVGRLTDAEAQTAQNELLDEVAVGFDEADVTPAAPTQARRRPIIALLVAILLPALALLTYQQVGAPHATDAEAVAGAGAMTATERLAQVQAAIAELQARTAADPEDGEAWAMLAAANKMIGENEKAIPAFERALALLGPHPRLLADLAEAIAITQGGRFAGRPTELLGQALANDPRDPKANGLMGAAMFQAGDMGRARTHLEALLAQLDPASQQAAQIRDVLADIGGDPGAAGETGDAPSAEGPTLVAGQVEIDAAQLADLPPSATVFVSARAPSGPRMPFAAVRQPLAHFNGGFALGDAQSMLAQRKLSDAGEVVVEVRISASGNAAPAAGDVFGVSAPVAPGAPGATDLVVRIDQVVP